MSTADVRFRSVTQTLHSGDQERPDRVGEELADDARIWRVYDKIAREDDRERIATWNRGLDNLALFAGILSAVTTTFIVEAQTDMKPDYSELTFRALVATAGGEPFKPEPFTVPANARAVNCLWISSLMFSLSAALIAIMGKDWIGMYSARPVCNARQWAEMRTYRLLCIERWRMSGVIASAPVLLHISLVLFVPGLVVFIAPDPFTQRLAFGLSVAAGLLYLFMALSAAVFASSPFKSPATQALRGLISWFIALTLETTRTVAVLVQSVASDLYACCRGKYRAWRHGDAVWARNASSASSSRPYRLFSPRAGPRDQTQPQHPRGLMDSVLLSLKGFTVRSAVELVSRIFGTVSHSVLSSTWSDVSPIRTAKLLAESLSWLSSASQAPEVFRALIFALGDLEIGPLVGVSISPRFGTRIRAEIGYTWKKVDFLTLSRYILANRNLAVPSVVPPEHLKMRLDSERSRYTRCEDGLAALFRIGTEVRPGDVWKYCPKVVFQPRMIELLLPNLRDFHHGAYNLIFLMNRYYDILTLPLSACEAALLELLPSPERYQHAIQHEYAGCSGIVELLTFIALNYGVSSAMIQLIGRVLPSFHGEHRGALHSWNWSSYQLACLVSSLPLMPENYYLRDDAVEPPLSWETRRFECSVARTVLRVLSFERGIDFDDCVRIARESGRPMITDFQLPDRVLHVLLCHPRSILEDDDKLDIIRVILQTKSLFRLHFNGISNGRDIWQNFHELMLTITQQLGRLLGSEYRRDALQGVHFFGLFVLSNATGENTWERWSLGSYLRCQGARVRNEPRVAESMRRLLSELKRVYAHCETFEELRAHWDRIGLPPVDGWSFDNSSTIAEIITSPPPPPPSLPSPVPDMGNEDADVKETALR